MNRHPLLHHGLVVLSLGLAAGPALADDDCDAPVEQWQSREAVHQMAVAQGWQVQRLKIDDGCYEIRGTDAQGRAFKAKIDPQTLKVVEMKHRDRSRERGRDRDRDPAAPDLGPSHPNAPAAPSTLLTPGTAPRGHVE